MRILVVPLRRLCWIFWAVLRWAAAATLHAVTWPSRSFFILIAAKLVASWVAISIASRLVRNRDSARLITIVAWPIAALAIVGLLAPVTSALDAAAFTIGERRISVLLIVKGLIVFAALIWLATIGGHSPSSASHAQAT